jgi:SAM-dependent methyltransferase
MDRTRLKILTGKIRRRIRATLRRAPPARAKRPETYLEAEPWTIDALEMGPGRLQIAGWALPPAQHPERARFLWNGRRFAEQTYPIDRPDIAAFFPQRAAAAPSGYVCAQPGTALDDWFDDGCLHLCFEFDRQRQRYAFQHDWFYPDERLYPPLPDADRMLRVMGATSTTQFLLGGFTDFNKFKRLLTAIGAGGLDRRRRVLDWGVGCGRVARYFSAVPGIEFCGVDIDADNVDWCARNLPGRYSKVPLRPPAPLDAASFDLIYGISVLTHLHERDQRAWLAELHRLAAPGAIVLLSFHGTTVANYAGLSLAALDTHLDAVVREGFLVTSGNDQIRDFIDEPDYYINVSHSDDYVRRVWGEYFDVVDTIPGMTATHDLAVLRKR